MLILPLITVVLSLAVLVISADKFIHGAASIASKLEVSPLIIGLLILGFGTSAPEILVSVFAALDEKPALAFGNALGSNIANIAMVLGATALVNPITIKSAAIRREFILFLASIALCYVLIYDFDLSRFDGIMLIVLLIISLWWMVRMSKDSRTDHLQEEVEHDKDLVEFKKLSTAIIVTVIALIFLLVSSKTLVWAAAKIAGILGLSDLIIGLTIVAIGTSLPELAASIVAAVRKEHDLVIGNIIGSNIFNLLAVIGVSGTIKPFTILDIAIKRDFLIMTLLSVLLFAMIFLKKLELTILSRLSGFILLTSYILYLGLLSYQTI